MRLSNLERRDLGNVYLGGEDVEMDSFHTYFIEIRVSLKHSSCVIPSRRRVTSVLQGRGCHRREEASWPISEVLGLEAI